MQEDAFRAWLLARGAEAEAARNTRVHAVRTIEAKLSELGSPHADLDAAWNADSFSQLRQQLKNILKNFRDGGTDYRLLMPQSENPANRLANWRSWLGQYGQFLSGEPMGDRDADKIRQYVLEHYIEPARQADQSEVRVLVRDVNDALGLNQGWPNICQALQGSKFLEMADIGAPEQEGADQSSATVFSFRLDGAEAADANVRRLFVLFDSGGAAFKPVKNYNRRSGRSAFRLKPAGASNQTDEAIEVDTLTEVARGMLVDRLPARVQPLTGGQVNYIAYGKQRLVRYELDASIATEIGVPPEGSVGGSEEEIKPLATKQPDNVSSVVPLPTNLILYGPPGTGKTYSTAEEAVRLCGEAVPQDRAAVMASYRKLLDAGRIEFVTFHQSVSYEDFVEGLRPTQTSEGGTAGFELTPQQGVFRRIARRAETSTGSGEIEFNLKGRQIFKMSIGEAANPEDAHLFEEAINGGYALLGFEDLDWTDDRFTSRDAIIDAIRQSGTMGVGDLTSFSGRVQMPFIFRNWMKQGDIIVVSKGNSLFRAIGEVVGGYQFAPREGGTYAHRRAVRWLWIDRAGVPVSEIYARTFTMKSVYALTDSELNIPALERYIASQQPTGQKGPEPFVLVLDEINRANISKVFGELITLLEPDKRLGQQDALRVRLPYSGDMFGVPSNLHIIGTMNTADRSIALLDTALRRRFQFKELMPQPSLLNPVDGIDLAKLLLTMNERIEYLFDREHQIGHAYFIGCKSRADIDDVMRHKVIPLLTEYFYEDWSRVAAVLGDAHDGDGDRDGRFIDRRQLNVPKGIDGLDETAPRYRWSVRSDFSYAGFA